MHSSQFGHVNGLPKRKGRKNGRSDLLDLEGGPAVRPASPLAQLYLLLPGPL